MEEGFGAEDKVTGVAAALATAAGAGAGTAAAVVVAAAAVALGSFAAAIETGIVVVEDRKRREKYMWWGRFEQMREGGCFG